MMIRIVSVGKIRESYLQEAIAEYVKRLSAFSKVELVTVMDEKIPDKASLKEEEQIKEKEGKRLLEKIRSDDYVILLDLWGTQRDSVEFSKHLSERMLSGISSFTFVIGGSLGLSDAVRERANEKMSLSKMTFTHPFTKLILLEQIYRSFKILNGQPYHK